MGEILLRWTSEPLEPPRDATTGFTQSGLYQVGLYQMHLQLDRDGKPFAELDLRRVGYRQVREPAKI